MIFFCEVDNIYLGTFQYCKNVFLWLQKIVIMYLSFFFCVLLNKTVVNLSEWSQILKLRYTRQLVMFGQMLLLSVASFTLRNAGLEKFRP
jgi:hypothetical protein